MTSPAFIALASIFATGFVVGLINSAYIQSTLLWTLLRWLRCVFFSLAIALLLVRFTPLFENLSIAFAAGVLLYFATETFLYWLEIAAINFSDLPMFGKYVKTSSSWRAEKKYINLKKRIENSGFSKSGSFKTSLGDDFSLMLTSFDSRDKKTRLNVAFSPYTGTWRAAYHFISLSEDGKVFMTSSDCTPCGFVWPKNCEVNRFPLASNPMKLFKRHMKILAHSKKKISSTMPPPLEQLNGFISEMERANRAAGNLSDPIDEEFDGKMSYDCRCRTWVDLIKINYFPFLIS